MKKKSCLSIPKDFKQKLVIYILLVLSLLLDIYLFLSVDGLGLAPGLGYFYCGFILLFAVFTTGIFVKILKESESGKNPFDVFKKRQNSDDVEIIISNLQKIDSYKHIMSIANGIILIDGSGINVIKMIKGRGKLSNKNNIWTFNNKKINNPFDIKADNYYLIRDLELIYELDGVEVVNLSELIFRIENKLIKPKYNNEEIDELKKQVQYGYNQN